MYDTSKTTAIFQAAQSGIQNSLNYLYQNETTSINQSTLTNAIYQNTSGINSQFFQMISNQFNQLDTDNDGNLTAQEASSMLTGISTAGLSRDQITSLRSQGAIDDELASTIIANFSKIDTNGDGKVTEAEINAFMLNKDIQTKKDEQKELMIKNMSCFYDVDTTSTSTSSASTSTTAK